MDDHLLQIFEAELKTQCEFVILGARICNGQLERLPEVRGEPEEHLTVIHAIWFTLQGMLVSAANASKLLWGSKSADDREVRRPLRERVEVDEHSPFYSRQIRNDFEHFDERLEAWFAGSTDHVYVGRSLGSPNSIIMTRGEQAGLFGNFDSATGTVAFWEHAVELDPVIVEAERICDILGEYGWARP